MLTFFDTEMEQLEGAVILKSLSAIYTWVSKKSTRGAIKCVAAIDQSNESNTVQDVPCDNRFVGECLGPEDG